MEKGEDKITVFVADDDSEYRRFLKDSFKGAGIGARIFSFDREERLMNALIQSTASPDVIFLSFNNESETALNCLKRIRIKQKFSKVPVVVFSPCTYLKDINEAHDNGANLFVPKPLFMKHSAKTLEAIFFPKWRQELLNTNKYKFVLNAMAEDSDELKWQVS